MRRVSLVLASSLLLLGSVLVSPVRAVDPPWMAVFEPLQLLTLNLDLAPADWDRIRRDLTTEIEVPAQLWADGEAPILVSVRRKTSRALPSESNPVKVGLKVDINDLVDGQKWHGLTKLSLENGADSGVIREGVAWNLHRMASGSEGYGYLAALASWVRVNVNGQYIGVYVNAEQRDKQMLKNLGVWVEDQTWLYDQHDMSTIELEEGEPHSPAWIALCWSPFSSASKRNGGCSRPSDANLVSVLDGLVNTRALLAECAVDAISANDDALCTKGHNFQFADWSAAVGRTRMFFPWDLDQVLAKSSGNVYANGGGRKASLTAWQDVILRHPVYRARYNAIISGLLGGPMSSANVDAFLASLKPVLIDALATDPYPTVANPGAAFDDLRAWYAARVTNVLSQVAANNNPPPR